MKVVLTETSLLWTANKSTFYINWCAEVITISQGFGPYSSTQAITTTKEQIKNIESQLTTSISPEDLQTLQSKIQTNIDLHKRDTETRKRNKFARDLQDYEQNRVYRWRDNPSTNKYTHRTAKSSTDYTSSGSDMDQRQSTIQSVPFLGQTRRRPNRRRRGEAIGTRGNLDFTRITRSQTHNW
ncbi:uncharacterized protein [Phyllobates terribilis]